MVARNPYVGPEALSVGQRIYGRNDDINNLRDLLIAQRVVLLYSPSGAGKTSLIQAGLLRELQEKEGFRVCLVRGFRGGQGTGNRYLGNLIDVLQGALAEDVPNKMPPGTRLEGYLKQLRLTGGPTRDTPEENDVVLIFDQFEEIFTLDPFDHDAKADFFRELGRALKDRTRWVLFSMREDHIAALDDYLHLLPTQMKTRYRLGLLERPQAREAIERPAGEEGVEYAKGVADLLIDDLCQVRWQTQEGGTELRKGNVVEPVQLQVVCRRLWEHRFPHAFEPPETISEEDVQQVSVDRALEDFYADMVMTAALAAHTPERDLREWVGGMLVTPQGLRGQVMWEPRKSGGLTNKAIGHLEDAHIVRLEARGDRRWYELTHDRLVTPILDNNRTWRKTNLNDLQMKTLEWLARGKSRDFGLSWGELWESWRWKVANQEIVRASENEFFRHARHLKIIYRLFPVVGFAAVVGGCLALLWQYNRTVASEKRYEISALAYKTQASALRRYMDQTLPGAVKVANEYRKLRDANSRETLRATIRETLITSLENAADLHRLLLGDGRQLRAVTFQPSDGPDPLVAFGGRGGEVRISSANGIPVRTLQACNRNTVYSLAFNPDGSLLAAGCGDGKVAIWDSADWKERSRWEAHKDGAWIVRFNRDGKLLASSGRDSKIRLMRLNPDGSIQTAVPAELRPSAPEMEFKGEIWSLAMSPKDDRLVAGDGKERLWECDTGARLECTQLVDRRSPDERDNGDATTLAIAFSADGKSMVTGHWNGELLSWDMTAEQPALRAEPRILAKRPSAINSAVFVERRGRPWVAFGADGLRLVPTSSADNASQRPLVAGDEVYALSLHPKTGLLAAATRGGYVALIQSRIPQENVARRLTLESDASQQLHASAEARRRRRGAVLETDTEKTRLVIASGKELLLVDPVKAQGEHILQTLAAEQVGQDVVLRVTAATKQQVATLGNDYSVKFWTVRDVMRENPLLTPLDTKFFEEFFKQSDIGRVERMRILLSPDGNHLLCSSESTGMLLLVDLKSGEREVTSLETQLSGTRELAFSPDGTLFAAAGKLAEQHRKTTEEGIVIKEGFAVWEFSRGKVNPRVSRSMPHAAYELALIRDGKGNPLVVAGGMEGQISVWNAMTGDKVCRNCRPHALRRAWNMIAGNKLDKPKAGDLHVDSRPVEQFTFSQQASLLAAADDYGRITLWDTSPTEPESWDMIELGGRAGMTRMKLGLLGFDLEGSSLISAADDLRVWDVNIASLRNKVCGLLGEGAAARDRPLPSLMSEALEACRRRPTE